MQSEFNVCVQTFYCKSIVGYIGHCFRHSEHAITKLLSLPLAGRLTSLRLEGRRGVPSESAQAARNLLSNLGVRVGDLVAGRPQIRGHSGYVFRWGEGWFEELRDGGPGWEFARHDKSAIDLRVELLLDIFRRRRGFARPSILNHLQGALEDVSGEGPAVFNDD